MAAYTIGVDFGSLSCRAVLVRVQDGQELATATFAYPNGVIDAVLPTGGAALTPGTALQDPADYLAALGAVIPAVIGRAGVRREEVVGIGVDCTCCTVLPVRADGTPLCFDGAFSKNPHAYVKMWKDHTAASYAARLNAVAARRGEKWLDTCGGKLSASFMLPKIYQILDEAPEVYAAADAFLEAGDWITYCLTGVPARSYQLAAYKSQYQKDVGYPSEDFLAEVDGRLRYLVRDKLPYPVFPAGAAVGTVTPAAAARFGLAAGTAVAVAAPDAHVAVGALSLSRAGEAFAIFGTSACFFVLGEARRDLTGICGAVEDGILPGFVGYEAGLAAFGDLFAYAAEHLVSRACLTEAAARGISALELLSEKAAKKAPGESGVLALNWFGGNRSPLNDPLLSGAFVGITLQTAPEDLLRALFEATAFGTRCVLESFAAAGLPIGSLAASGGIAHKNPFLMQLFADVLGVEVRVAKTAEAAAHGVAINAAVAAGAYPTLGAAISKMASACDTVYRPNAAARAVYDALFAEYKTLQEYFGRGGNDVMKALRRIAAGGKEA